ncbi:MAG: hypothetical protein NT069_03815 [Planctomycetota bacterium]|nr:hypothetical protein [Planctomycetota bacterium]
MINFGHVIAWKTRALTVSRQAVWRQRPTHYAGSRDRVPRNWEAPASMAVGPASTPPIFAQDPFAQHQVVRGPMLRDPQSQSASSQLQVDVGQFDFDDDLVQGIANLDREVALLPKLFQIKFNTKHPLLESEWRFHDMGYGSNNDRRILRLYGFTPPGNVIDLAEGYKEAALRIMSAGYRPGLMPLDKDDELKAWYGSAPDFHPQLPRTASCELNRDVVHAGDVLPLIDRIQGPRGGGRGGVPERMTQAFLNMYRAQQALLRQQDPPPTTEIQELQRKIDLLTKFLGTLN